MVTIFKWKLHPGIHQVITLKLQDDHSEEDEESTEYGCGVRKAPLVSSESRERI